ncbi:MAG TPA: 3D domain-containing protein [Blastocatellia bacterium]|nr:3D domain-containing protein [Blastocatellia bacterium]
MIRISVRLFSVISILSVGVIGYSLSYEVGRVIAADNPPVETIETPGAFKELPEAGDGITSKRAGETNIAGSAPLPLNQLSVDATKGTIPSRIGDSELLDFHATAYCLKGRTASGHHVRPGIIAADPKVLPLGTVVHLRAGSYTGTYTVLDTGGRIRGRLIDVYVPTYREAKQFGRRSVKIRILGQAKGTSPRAAKGPVVAKELTR